MNAALLKDVASKIAAPLSFVINLSLQTGIESLNWKVVYLTPLYKKSDETEASNYRPISVFQYIQKFKRESCSLSTSKLCRAK